MLVASVIVLNSNPNTGNFYIGSNSEGESKIGFISASECSSSLTDTSSLEFLGYSYVNIILNVKGDFCVLNSNDIYITDDYLTIFPNPIMSLPNISIDGIESGSIIVLTLTGNNLVQGEAISSCTSQFNVNGKYGLYFIEEVTLNNKEAIFKVMKD